LAGADAADNPEAGTAAIAGDDGDDDDDDEGDGKGDGKDDGCAPEDPAATAGLDAGAVGITAEDDCEVGAAALICEADSYATGTEPELWARRPDSVSRFSR
jgi:hypothetical protein